MNCLIKYCIQHVHRVKTLLFNCYGVTIFPQLQFGSIRFRSRAVFEPGIVSIPEISLRVILIPANDRNSERRYSTCDSDNFGASSNLSPFFHSFKFPVKFRSFRANYESLEAIFSASKHASIEFLCFSFLSYSAGL